jgi:ABC-type amino acid transport substrate-binding protein
MKRWIVLLTTMAVSLSAAACDRVGSDPVWDRIESSGRIVIGTSADYAPFEYYDEAFEITGFDAAIARELGVRLGLEVELVDIAFDGLFTALEIGQIDAAISAITVTPKVTLFGLHRCLLLWQGLRPGKRDIDVRPHPGSGAAGAVPRRGPAGHRLRDVAPDESGGPWTDAGVELVAYEEPAHAVSDLRQGRNDVVVMDTRPADEYLDEGGLRLVGQGLNPQQYALAVPEGATVLRDRLNQALRDMRNDGTLARLATVYLLLDDYEAEALPTPTPLPGPTATPPACYDGMEFVDDVTVPDGTEMNPGQDFDKVWRVRNTGTCAWDSSYGLAFVQGDRMDGDPVSVSGTVSSGSTYDVTIDQEAPDDPGTYGGVWEMPNGKDTPICERLWVEIVVPGAPAPTAAPPTATPVPPVLPTPAPAPVIEYFTAEPVSLPMGGVITVSWSFSGEDLASATLIRVDPDGLVVPLYGGDDVTSPGVYEDLAAKAGLVSYTLVVSSEFGGSTVATVLVEVLAVEVQPLQ